MVPVPTAAGYGGKCFPENVDAMRRFLMNGKLGMVWLFPSLKECKAKQNCSAPTFLREGEIFAKTIYENSSHGGNGLYRLELGPPAC